MVLACLWVLTGTAGAACPTQETPDAGPQCNLPFAGDPSLPPVYELITMTDGQEIVPLMPGGGLPLMFPPQGGRVSFVGVRAQNVDPCTVELSASLRDPLSGQVRLESRTVNLRINEDGGAQSSRSTLSTWSNIPLCPNQWASQDIQGHVFRLDVSMVERGGRQYQDTLLVVPFCAEPSQFAGCDCMCRKDYRLGMTCQPPDGGPADGGEADGGDGDGGNIGDDAGM